MSGESALHVRLVERLVATIEREHANRRDFVIFADHHAHGRNRPPQIGGYTPDVYASNIPATFRIIGEAKTAKDFKSDRSQRQIIAFFDHLSLYPHSSFYLAVPWTVVARARYVIKSLRRPEHGEVLTNILHLI
jgi:hypothetical protein